MLAQPTRIDLLELDIDIRLMKLWDEVNAAAQTDNWSEEWIATMAKFIRAAYGKGYTDALREDNLGQLCRDHGFKIPARRIAA